MRVCIPEVLTGLLSIDPSVGSASSMPGWAFYLKGELLASGTIKIGVNLPLERKMQILKYEMDKLYERFSPEVLAYEHITPLFRGGNGFGGMDANSHVSLCKGLGAILAAGTDVCPKYYVKVRAAVWKKLVSKSHIKGDEADAQEIGRIVIDLAKFIQSKHLDKVQKDSANIKVVDKLPKKSKTKLIGGSSGKTRRTSVARSRKVVEKGVDSDWSSSTEWKEKTE